jgi:hypothetical protein
MEVVEAANNNAQELQNERWQPAQRKNTQRRTEAPWATKGDDSATWIGKVK